MHVDPLELEIGFRMIGLTDPARGGDLLDRLKTVRQRVAREMIPRRRGAIVNIASIAGKGYAGTSNAIYAASKGAVIALTADEEGGGFALIRQPDILLGERRLGMLGGEQIIELIEPHLLLERRLAGEAVQQHGEPP